MGDKAAALCTSLRQEVFERIEASPGAGSHSLEGSFVATRPRSPVYVFGRSERVYTKASTTPGPDAYQSPEKDSLLHGTFDSRFQNLPRTKFALGPRTEGHGIDSPAPGTYDVVTASNAVHPTSPMYSISKAPRDEAHLISKFPGPGAYSSDSGLGRQVMSARPTSAGMKFGSSHRAGDHVSSTPGPASYAVDQIDGMGGRPASSSRPRSATPRIGTGLRFTTRLVGGPGPAYSPDSEAVLPTSPSFSFGLDARDPRRRTASASPGPGSYAVDTIDSVGRKQASSYRASSPIAKFGMSGRFGGKEHDGPAPGQYGVVGDTKFSTAPRQVFGTSHRAGETLPFAPGPGAYAPTVNSIRPRSARFAFGSSSRFHGYGVSDTPGPDAYGSSLKNNLLHRAPAATFGTSPRDGKVYHQSPGTLYDTDKSLASTRPRSARTRIGTATRFPLHEKNKTPGPGDYGIPRKPLPGSPAFTMRAR